MMQGTGQRVGLVAALIVAGVGVLGSCSSGEPAEVGALISELQAGGAERAEAVLMRLATYGPGARRALPEIEPLTEQEENESLSWVAKAADYLIAPVPEGGLEFLFQTIDTDILKGLIRMAEQEDPRVRAVGLVSLSWRIHETIRPLETGGLVKVEVTTNDPDIDRAIELLVANLSDESVSVRRAAALGLTSLATRSEMIPSVKKAVPALLARREDDDGLTRDLATLALGEGSESDPASVEAAELWRSESENFLERTWVAAESVIGQPIP